MDNYYNLNIIPIILKRFEVNNIIISSEHDEKTKNQIFNYCTKYNSKDSFEYKIIEDYPLNELKNLNNYDAIFLNDDPNWYTTYNELKIIKQNNENFPLVFICNSIFPHKRRDSYLNPDSIPKEFKNEYSDRFIYENINIYDGYYHAITENTAKNGVLTGIEDFLDENDSIEIMDIKFINETIILYDKNKISQTILNDLFEEIREYNINSEILSSKINENKLLKDYIFKHTVDKNNITTSEEFETDLDKKEKKINYYENKIKLYDSKLNFKDSQIKVFTSKLDLKDSQIKNIESKLANRENEINQLNSQIISLKKDMDFIQNKFNNKEKEYYNEIKSLRKEIDFKEEYLKNKTNEFKTEIKNKQNDLNNIENRYMRQISDNEYCIGCYEEEIANNHYEIEYLQKNNLIKKILDPFSHIFLFIKSSPSERALNLKLYKALKNSECFDIGYYLNNNEDIINSKWCKYFSPELHYVCHGFEEKREFNKKKYGNTKKELLEYISN